MDSGQLRHLSTIDIEYLQSVKVKLQKWREDKRELEETAKLLESELESKDKVLFESCKGFHKLEEKHWGIVDALDSKQKQLQCARGKDT